jgi:hypothetical protein
MSRNPNPPNITGSPAEAMKESALEQFIPRETIQPETLIEKQCRVLAQERAR